jgi:hypothetical protein
MDSPVYSRDRSNGGRSDGAWRILNQNGGFNDRQTGQVGLAS